MTLIPRSLEEWYKPFTREERVWFIIALIVAFIMAATTLAWHVADPDHNVPSISVEVSPSDFINKAFEFAEKYSGKVIPEGVEIYLAGMQFRWVPSELRLKRGVTYRIWVSSADVIHGLSIIGNGVVYNIMVMPGMAYLMHIRFDQPGVYEIRCNEYCGAGHQFMVGKIIVE